MAYSSVRVQFEIGHEASVRTKKTPEGFTHDWEVFVRGADNTDIQCFVDKVVFHLHETFPKPRRVIKEPPYSVKESGYAGFVLPIDVYLKNKEEPKKISFQYDLNLQSSGPPISRVLREPRVFQNPSEDFRRKLIRGGGVGVDTPSEVQTEDLKPIPSVIQNKTKQTDSSVKKHKSDQVSNHSFAELFGPPIRRIPEPKKLPEPLKKLPDDLPKEKKKPSKHGSYKDEKETTKEKDKYLEKEKTKERDKSKEKPTKRLSSPPPVLQIKTKDEYKKYEEKEKKKDEHDDRKKRKEEKDKKERTKDVKELDRQFEKECKKDKKEVKDGDYLKKLNSSKLNEAKANFEKHNSEVIEKEKERIEKEKDKHKHRHKKKEKEKNREKEKHRKEKEKSEKDLKEREREKEKSNRKKHEEVREKEEKKRKSRSPSLVQERVKKGPLNALLDELGSSDSASPLSEEESISPVKALPKPHGKIVPETKTQTVINVSSKMKSTNACAPNGGRHDKEVDKTSKLDDLCVMKNAKEKSFSRKSKKLEKDADKKRGKEEHKVRSGSSEREKEDEEAEKDRIKEERERSEKERTEDEKAKPKDKETRKRKREKSEEKHIKTKKENNLSASQSTVPVEFPNDAEEIRRSDKFTKEYVAQLRDLQHRIMTLEDNAELQKVVKVIAETGQYEITKKTFDFDLCALDFETVKRLQEFFAPT